MKGAKLELFIFRKSSKDLRPENHGRRTVSIVDWRQSRNQRERRVLDSQIPLNGFPENGRCRRLDADR